MGVASTGAGAPSKLVPQLEQKDSPAGLAAPHDEQIWVPAEAAAGTAVGAAVGAALLNGSPHSSQNAEPSGFS